MPKPKKKTNPVQHQKLLDAHSYNNFVGLLRFVLDISVGTSVFPLLPQEEIKRLFKARFHSILVQAAPGQNIPSAIIKTAKKVAAVLFESTPLPVSIGELEEAPFQSYFSILFTLSAYANRLKIHEYPAAARVKEALIPFATFDSSPNHENAMQQYSSTMKMLSILFTRLDDFFYATKHETRTYTAGNTHIGFCMELYRTPALKSTITLDGKPRPVYQVAWLSEESGLHPDPAYIEPGLIKLPPGKPLDLFIQAHALARLEERMDGMDIGMLHFSLFYSCQKPEVHRNHRGEWLFAFKLMDVKTGYFIADIVGRKIIFRTFLFLTHNGTPEGEKLNRLIGLKKEDKEWLNIDKLSTFLNSDITRDARLRQLFIDAGCESLFAVAQDLSISEQMKPEKKIADFIIRYLRLGEK